MKCVLCALVTVMFSTLSSTVVADEAAIVKPLKEKGAWITIEAGQVRSVSIFKKVKKLKESA